MKKNFLSYISVALILLSTISFLISSFNVNNIFLLQSGFVLGGIYGLLLLIRNLLINNFNLLLLGSGSYLLFAFGGFAYSIYNTGLEYIFYKFHLWGYAFEKIDICYAGIYSNIFCLTLLFISNISRANYNIAEYYINRIREGIYIYKKELFIYLLFLISLKIYLILSGQINFTFVAKEVEPQYGDIGSILPYLTLTISPSGIFINSLLLFSKAINRRILLICLLVDIIYIFSLGRRPLINHSMIFIMAFFMIKKTPNLISTKKIKQIDNLKIDRRILNYIIVMLILSFVIFIAIKFISVLRISLLDSSLVSKSLLEIFYQEIMTGRIWTYIFGSQEELELAFQENANIRNAFTISYLAHLIHGLFKYKSFAGGEILISSIIQIIPSVSGIVDKSSNIQGEAIISNLTQFEIVDGANTFIAYSLADFFIFGSLIYATIMFMVNVLFLGIIKNISKKSILLLTIAFSCISYSYMQMNESSPTNLFLVVREIIIFTFLYKTITIFIGNKNRPLFINNSK